MAHVKEDLDVLKNAQEIDRELYEAIMRLEEIPGERSKSRQRFETEKNHLVTLEASVKKLLLTQKQKESLLVEKETQIKKLDGQLGQVKTNREYTALQQEIASAKADNSLLEEEIIRILDEVEAGQEEVKKEAERLKQYQKDYELKDQELFENEKALKEKIQGLKTKREDMLGQLNPEVKNLYDRIVEKKKGLAIVKINGEVCGACQMQLRPQIINEVQLAATLVLCENCSRILYIE